MSLPYRLIDTNIVSYLMKRHTLATVYAPHLIGFQLAIAVQTVGELREGGLLAGWSQRRWDELAAILQGFLILDATMDVSERWADVRASRRNQPIGVADAWIAATALAFGLELVTHNPADFRNIPNLTVVTETP